MSIDMQARIMLSPINIVKQNDDELDDKTKAAPHARHFLCDD
jgi:hypothetical protein